MTDFRELCDGLLDELEFQTDWSTAEELKERARAALAEPEPEEPTDGELELLADRHMITDGQTGAVHLEHLDFARAVLARWGR